MKFKNKLFSLSLVFLLLFAAVTSGIKPANAYDMENHYWLKMKLAINCGFSLDNARLIAMGDWGIDVNDDTKPVKIGSGKDTSKWKWHALPSENPDQDKSTTSVGNQEIKQRQHELFERALNAENTPTKLIDFGQYLHYLEDKWSHWGSTTFLGHALDVVLPGVEDSDHSHTNPDFYKLMVFDSMSSLGKLAKNMGIYSECTSDLLPLDTYHSAPEYGQDFPWVSPQEIKRTQDPQKFRNDVAEQLHSWKKSKLIDDNIQISKEHGPQAVAENIIKEIANETGLTVQKVKDDGAFMKVPIDKDGAISLQLPDDVSAALVVIKNYNSGQTSIPSWIKNNAKYWSDDKIDDATFATGIGYLINQGVINANVIASADSSISIDEQIQIPSWIKNNAKYWSEGGIGDSDFLSGIQYLVNNDVISFTKDKTSTQPSSANYDVVLKIQDSVTGLPLDALVTLSGNSHTKTLKTDRDGNVHFSMPAGDYVVQVDNEKHLRLHQNLIVAGNIQQTLELQTTSSQTYATETPSTPSESSTTSTPPTSSASQSIIVSASPTVSSFIHNIGSSPCPTPITGISLSSNQQGSWDVSSKPSWATVIVKGNSATVSFNCQLSQYVTQSLSGNIVFQFTGTSGNTATTTVLISGQINQG